ncbi:MAG: UvrD-helicase domain-containing protein [Succinivibrionaceae bacterium]|nr:UvrD-helicase domain-containing protein [Succinivibrionaceae bacterium]
MSADELNDRQQEAVRYIAGPCLVIAGAGSGKTKVITEKISYLMKEAGLRGYEICAVTFTNKAAREMRNRVSRVIEHNLHKGLLITTFHSLGLHILKREYARVGLRKNFILMDPGDQKSMVTSIYREMLSNGNDESTVDEEVVAETLRAISRAKMKGLSPDEFMTQATAQDQVHGIIYGQYENLMNAYSAVDFDDLVLKPMKLLQTDEEARKRWQSRFRHILVDEYQDTNSTQYEFLKLLIGIRRKFTFVGDDDQSIYAWRGAEPENINKLSQDFPELKIIKLEQNYRSCGRILHIANSLIANNSHLISKRLFSSFAYGDPVVIRETRDPVREAEYVSAEIYSQRVSRNLKFRDFGVLYRTNFQSREMEKIFRENRIPYRINGDVSFFDRAEVKDIMSYYRVLANPNDDNALIRIINVPRREIGNVTKQKLGEYARSNGLSLYEAISSFELRQELSSKAGEALAGFKEMIEDFRERIEDGEETEVISDLFDSIGYMAHLMSDSPTEQVAAIKYDNVLTLQKWLIMKLKGSPSEGMPPAEFGDAVSSLCLREMLDQSDSDSNPELDQVQMMTVHAAKGLEFTSVFIIGCEENIIPHQNSIENNTIEEERRLMYVGITRAKRYLTITHCLSRKQEKAKISRFIKELPQEDLAFETIASAKEVNHDRNIEAMDRLLNNLLNE